jgi:hypothetical protein
MSYMNFVVEPQVKSGSHRLTVSGLFNYKPAGAVDRVTVTGLVRRPMAVFLSGRPLPADQWSFDQHRYVLEMHHLEHALHANFVIEWRY